MSSATFALVNQPHGRTARGTSARGRRLRQGGSPLARLVPARVVSALADALPTPRAYTAQPSSRRLQKSACFQRPVVLAREGSRRGVTAEALLRQATPTRPLRGEAREPALDFDSVATSSDRPHAAPIAPGGPAKTRGWKCAAFHPTWAAVAQRVSASSSSGHRRRRSVSSKPTLWVKASALSCSSEVER